VTSTTRRRSYGVKGAPYAHPSPTTTLKRARSAPYFFLLPATILFALFFALPIGYAVWLSFRKVKVSAPAPAARSGPAWRTTPPP